MAEDGIRKPLSQCTGRSSDAVKQLEESPLATPQLLLILEKIARRVIVDILGHYGLGKTIVTETDRMVNGGVVHLMLELPKRIECPCRQRVGLGDLPHDPCRVCAVRLLS